MRKQNVFFTNYWQENVMMKAKKWLLNRDFDELIYTSNQFAYNFFFLLRLIDRTMLAALFHRTSHMSNFVAGASILRGGSRAFSSTPATNNYKYVHEADPSMEWKDIIERSANVIFWGELWRGKVSQVLVVSFYLNILKNWY